MRKSVTFFFEGCPQDSQSDYGFIISLHPIHPINNIVLKVTNQHALRHIIYKKGIIKNLQYYENDNETMDRRHYQKQ